MQEITIRIPTSQFAYLEIKHTGTVESALHLHNKTLKAYQDSLKTPTVSLETPSNSGLDKVSMLRLLHKYMTTNTLEMEDVESLGTDKIYSQKDVVGLIKNVFAKITRDSNQDLRADNINRIID